MIADQGGLSEAVCVPPGTEPAGRPCMTFGSSDSCTLETHCFKFGPMHGACATFCDQNMECPAILECLLHPSGLSGYCLPFCDPIASPCLNMAGCYPFVHEAVSRFACLPAAPFMTNPGGPCMFSIDCRPGLTKRALAAATRIGVVDVDHGETSCMTPDARTYIKKTLAHRKKKAAARR